MKSQAIAAILSSLNDECGRLNDLDWNESKDAIRTVLRAYDAVGKLRAEDVPMDRLDRINGEGGALSWCGRSFAEHPDRCECQGHDPIPHRHYDHAPYGCARCIACKAYAPVSDGAAPAKEVVGSLKPLRAEGSGDDVSSPPCEVFADSGNRYTACGPDLKYGNVCSVCGWAESAHTDEVRSIMRGEHPESVPDGRGGFYRRPKWGSPHTKSSC